MSENGKKNSFSLQVNVIYTVAATYTINYFQHYYFDFLLFTAFKTIIFFIILTVS